MQEILEALEMRSRKTIDEISAYSMGSDARLSADQVS
jgi:hypothetical protein